MTRASPTKKTSPEQLVEETAEIFHTYVGKGVNIPGIGDEDTDPDLNVDGIQSLLRVHFVLTGSDRPFTGEQTDPTVVPFMKGLSERIRRLQRSTYQESQLVKGGIEGKVDWGETVEMYANRGFVDKSRFVCSQPQTEYDTAENRVLVRLLEEIQSIFENELESAVEDPDSYTWLKEWVVEPNLLRTLENVLTQNVYLRDINPPERISPRDITAVKRSRRPLYREAAKLLENYYKLQNNDISLDEARDILTNVYVRPDTDKGGRLFELYWTFELLKQFSERQLRVVKSGTDLIASCMAEDEHYELYHHSEGPDGMTFRAKFSDVSEELSLLEGRENVSFFERLYAVHHDAREYSKEALASEKRQDLWSGVPDIVLVRYDENDNLSGVFIGECKYSRNIQEIKKGIAELLEYMYYGKYRDSYFMNPSSSEESGDETIPVEGCVFVDQLPEGASDDGLPISLVDRGADYSIPWLSSTENRPS